MEATRFVPMSLLSELDQAIAVGQAAEHLGEAKAVASTEGHAKGEILVYVRAGIMTAVPVSVSFGNSGVNTAA